MNFEEAKKVLYSGGKVTIYDEDFYKHCWHVEYDDIEKKAKICFPYGECDLRDIRVISYYNELKRSKDIVPCEPDTSFSLQTGEFEKAFRALMKGKKISNGTIGIKLETRSNLNESYMEFRYYCRNGCTYTSDTLEIKIQDIILNDWEIEN